MEYYIIRLDPAGNILWHKMYGGNNQDGAESIQQTTNGGYIIAGYSGSTDISGVTNNGNYDFYVVKIDTIQTKMKIFLQQAFLLLKRMVSGVFLKWWTGLGEKENRLSRKNLT